MKIFITGISGLLGLNWALELSAKHEVYGCWRTHPVKIPGVETAGVDLTDFRAARETVEAVGPEVIVHTAALADVDACEESPLRAQAGNVRASENVARVAAACKARLVHISTDQLFDGTAPMRTETDPVTPANEYARTKRAAEVAVAARCPRALIVRTNFFGWGTPLRPSFSDWILRGLRQGKELTMFFDSYFTPLLANDLILLVHGLLECGAEGVYHVVGRDRLTKYAFALLLAEAFGYDAGLIRAIPTATKGLRAPRPRDLSLSCGKTAARLDCALPGVREGLERLRTLEERGWPERLAAASVGRAERAGSVEAREGRVGRDGV